MTWYALTEQEEFYKIYGLEVVAIPTHRPMVREDDDRPRRYRSEDAKFKPRDRRSSSMSRRLAGPVLVGTDQ
jgi:preprotein translocase subunit SecA